MGLLNRLLGLGSKKKMNEDAMNGVDMVKVGLMYYLLPECEANFGKDYAAPLVAAVVNTVFSEIPSNETGRRFIQNENNINNVMFVIENGIKPDEKLRQIITNAVRVKCTLLYAMNSNLSESECIRLSHEPIHHLKKFEILVPGGDMPGLSDFLQNAAEFIKTCEADLDYHKTQRK